MKNILVVCGIVSCLFGLLPAGVWAEEIPFGVTPKEITVSGSVVPTADEIGTVGFLKKTGMITDDYEYAAGNRTGVKIGSIDYTIRFWNVGKMGGTSGMLFWKKDYGKAVMYIDYNVSENGYIIGDQQDNSKLGLPNSWPVVPATDAPDIHQASCVMGFSGGPTGTFAGTCNDGSKITGRIGAGNFILFDRIERTSGSKGLELGLIPVTGVDLRLNSEFSDWKFDDSGLVDSGTRFNSISGQVEVRHGADADGWKSAQLDTVLYVDDHVKTSDESEAILSFADLSTFTMKPETEIVLNAPPSKANKWKLVTGKVMANIRKMMKDGSMEIDMSQAVAGIKGTRFILTETGSESKIEVTEGTVAFRSKANGQEAMVSAGETVTSTQAGLSEKTKFDASSADAELIKATSATQIQPPVPETISFTPRADTDMAVYAGAGALLLIAAFGISRKYKRKKKKNTGTLVRSQAQTAEPAVTTDEKSL